MNNKKAFLLLWKWAIKNFRRKWFKYKAIDKFLKDGEIEREGGKLYMVRKCFQTVKNNRVTEHWLTIKLFVLKPYIDTDLLREMKGTEDKKREE